MKNALFTAVAAVATAIVAQAGSAPAPVGKGSPPPVVADCCPTLRYTNLELGYIHSDGESAGTANGGFLDLNYDLGNNIFVDSTLTFQSGDFDQNEVKLGLGYYLPLSESFHLTARAGWSYLDEDNGDLNGVYIAPGFRAKISCNLEAYAKAYYHNYDSGAGDSWSIGGGLIYNLCEKMAITTGYAHSLGEEDAGWSLQAGIRYSF